MNIELVYFTGCPHVETARKNLREACEALGLPAEWKEWNQNDQNIPQHLKVLGSPSVLVKNTDVAGGPGKCSQEKFCRIYQDGQNAPNVEIIKNALHQGLHS